MNELPELRSDQDVDALLARLRAKIAPPPASIASAIVPTAGSSHALNDYLAAQGEAAATIVRALHVMADAIDELAADPASVRSTTRTRSATPRRTHSRRKSR